MAIDKDTKKIIRFLRNMQGSRQYKGTDKLARQYRQEANINKQLTK